MTEITKPHDLFFKQVFSQPDVAEYFVMNFLPPNVTGHLKPNTFRLSKGSFVDERLKEHSSDLLYQVDFKDGNEAYVYLLFEHKSSPDSKVAYQLLRYLTRILEHTTEGGTKPVRQVLPVVLYHGTDPWNVSLNFSGLYEPLKTVWAGLLDFTYILCDLSAYSDEEIKSRALLSTTLALGLLLMKNFFSPDLSKRLRGYFELVDNMEQQSALKFVEAAFRYLGAAEGRVTDKDLTQALEDALGDKGESYVESILDRWMNEGVEKGMQQGMQQGTQQGMLRGAASLTIRQLTRRFGKLDDATEMRIRQLPLQEVERLGEDLLDFRDKSALRDWLDRAAH